MYTFKYTNPIEYGSSIKEYDYFYYNHGGDEVNSIIDSFGINTLYGQR